MRGAGRRTDRWMRHCGTADTGDGGCARDGARQGEAPHVQSTEAGSLERERRCRKASRSGGGSSHSGVESSRSGEEAVAAGEAAPQGPSFRPGGPGACACGRRYRAAPAPQNRRCPQPLPARSGRRPGAGCCPKSRTPAAPTGGQNVRRSDSQMRQLESVAPYAIGRRPPAAKFAVWI